MEQYVKDHQYGCQIKNSSRFFLVSVENMFLLFDNLYIRFRKILPHKAVNIKIRTFIFIAHYNCVGGFVCYHNTTNGKKDTSQTTAQAHRSVLLFKDFPKPHM